MFPVAAKEQKDKFGREGERMVVGKPRVVQPTIGEVKIYGSKIYMLKNGGALNIYANGNSEEINKEGYIVRMFTKTGEGNGEVYGRLSFLYKRLDMTIGRFKPGVIYTLDEKDVIEIKERHNFGPPRPRW